VKSPDYASYHQSDMVNKLRAFLVTGSVVVAPQSLTHHLWSQQETISAKEYTCPRPIVKQFSALGL
jgi:hypothetical protein